MNAGIILGFLAKIFSKKIVKKIGRKILRHIASEALRLAVEAEGKGMTGDEKRHYVLSHLKEKFATADGVKTVVLDAALIAAVARLQPDPPE